MVEQVRADSMEEVKAGDEDRVFYKLNPAKKIVVVVGELHHRVRPHHRRRLALYGLPQVAPKVGLSRRACPRPPPPCRCPSRSAARGPHPPSPDSSNAIILSVDGKPVTTSNPW